MFDNFVARESERENCKLIIYLLLLVYYFDHTTILILFRNNEITMESRIDQVYRSVLLTKFFTRGWGSPENLLRIIK